MTLYSFYKRFAGDIIALIGITIISLFLSSFLLQGETFNTGYQDWIYQVFRAESLRINGFTSWDHIWNNGISYWRAYQPVGSFLTACLATLLSVSTAKATVYLSVILYVIFRINLYVAARIIGIKPVIAASIALFSFEFVEFWGLLKDYSIAVGIVFIPLYIALWWKSFNNPKLRPLLALSVGLTVYIHPLVAVFNGLLWLILFINQKNRQTSSDFFKQALIIFLAAFFYIYTLLFIDGSFTDPYQFGLEFVTNISTYSKNIHAIFYVSIAISLILSILSGQKLPKPFKTATYVGWIILLGILLGIAFPYFSPLTRIQIVRTGFYWVIISLLTGGFLLNSAYKKWPGITSALCGVVSVIVIINAALTASIYAPVPVPKLGDPVAVYFRNKPSPLGSIYIIDSIISSYNSPTFRFYNGYNDHLLPNGSTLRLRELLSFAPGKAIPEEQLSAIEAHMKAYAVEYLFLDVENPAVTTLVTAKGFKNTGCVSSENISKCVLTPPWNVRLAGFVSSNFPTTKTANLDELATAIATDLYSPQTLPVSVTYPLSNQIIIPEVPAKNSGTLYIPESYSKLWHSSNGTVSAASNNMMLLRGEFSSQPITLTHNWGISLYIHYFFLVLAIALAVSNFRKKPSL